MICLNQEETRYFDTLRILQEKIWPNEIPKTPSYPHGENSLVDYLRAWSKTRPNHDVLIYYGYRMSFSELNRLSDQCASMLLSHGVKRGDRVAVVLGNCPQFLIAFYGILKIGAVYVPVNPLFKEAEMVYEFSDAGAEVVIALDSLSELLLYVKNKTPLTTVFTTALSEFLPENSEINLPAGLDASYQPMDGFKDFMQAVRTVLPEPIEHEVDLDAVAALNYTGGTTGLPKGCVHTQRDMIYTGATSATVNDLLGPEGQGAETDDISLNFLPMFWIAGENAGLINPVVTGGTMVLLARWDPLAVMQAVDLYKIRRCFLLVDNALEIMEHPELDRYNLRSLKTTRVASFVKKLSLDYRRRWQMLTGTVMAEGAWGMTETHTSDTFTSGMQENDQDLLGMPGFVGLPVPGTLIKICDFKTGALLNFGEKGEIVVYTPSLFKGYWNKPKETQAGIRSGWFHTGDIGTYDEKGYLHYLGRSKEMLKVRGMSVFPTEIEGLICKHPMVQEAAVVGRLDEDKGEVPVAFVRLRPDSALQASDLSNWCREQMASYKVPEIRLVEAWPLTQTGKIQKHKLLNPNA